MKKKSVLQALGLGILLTYGSTAAAADTLLATAELQHKQETLHAELWGNRLPNGYAEDLLVLLKDKDKKLMAAYAPSIKGGYNCMLQPVQVKKQQQASQQLLLSVGQGDWQAPVEFRVLDFAKPAQVEELFGSAASMGIVTNAYIKEGKLEVLLKDGSHNKVQLPAGLDADGRVEYGSIYSLAPYDVDQDGQQELLVSQQLNGRQQLLADVGAIWRLDENSGKWQQFSITIMTSTPTDKSNTVNDGMDTAYGVVLPRRLVVPGGEATYPVFASKNVELQNKVNKLLTHECEDYLQRFYQGRADMAFKIMRADDLLLTIQLISGKQSFVHHNVNIDPKTGELVRLEQILNAHDKDLLPLLNVLNTNKNVDYRDALPEEWYIEGHNLFLLQQVDGVDQVSGFAMGNLHKFLLNKKWIQQKLTDQSVLSEKRSK